MARFIDPETDPEGERPWSFLCWYDAEIGVYQSAASGGLTVDEECTGWWPVPETEDNHADAQ